MSAYGIGADTAVVTPADPATQGEPSRTTRADSNAPATIVKWIPGEAITFYAGIIGIGAAQGALTGTETPDELLERIEAGSLSWFFVGVAVAVALVILGTYSAPRVAGTRPSLWGLFVRIVLTVLAFALWTSALPGSWTYSLHVIRDMGAAYALLLIPVGIVFAVVAEALVKKADL